MCAYHPHIFLEELLLSSPHIYGSSAIKQGPRSFRWILFTYNRNIIILTIFIQVLIKTVFFILLCDSNIKILKIDALIMEERTKNKPNEFLCPRLYLTTFWWFNTNPIVVSQISWYALTSIVWNTFITACIFSLIATNSRGTRETVGHIFIAWTFWNNNLLPN